MTEPIIVTDEERQKVVTIRQSFADLTMRLGKVAYAQRALTQTQNDIEEQLDALAQDEEDFFGELFTKYGRGTLNVETGEFVPDKS